MDLSFLTWFDWFDISCRLTICMVTLYCGHTALFIEKLSKGEY